MRRLLIGTVIAVGAFALGAGAAAAVDYPATTGTLTVSATGGSEARIEGCGFAPGATVQLRIDDNAAGSTEADAEGCISTSVEVSGGDHTFTATGLNPDGGTLTLTGTLSSSSSGGFARTGAETGLIAGAALALVAVGGLFVAVTRRRSVTS